MEFIFGDDFDIMYDERLGRQLKRRHLNVASNSCNHSLERTLQEQQLGGGIVDEDYMLFLHHLRDYFQSSNSTRNDDDDGEDDDVDPHYKMFLEKLRVDGKSYVLKVALNNEVSLSLKYESEGDSSDDELVRASIRKVSAVYTESLETVKDLQMKSQHNQTDIAREDMMDSTKSRTNCTGNETMDSLVKDGTSEPVNHASGKEDRFSSEKHCPKESHLFEADIEREKKVDMVGKCYQIYLNGIKVEAGSTLSASEDAKLVKNEKINDERSSDSVVLVSYNASDFDEGSSTPFEPSKLFVTLMEEDAEQCFGNHNTSNDSGFREKLMDKLRETYGDEEYETLWQDMNERRPKERCFHFRSGTLKVCKKMDELGPSYLEQHPGDDFDIMYDERLGRQLKRRRLLNVSSNSCNHSLERILQEQQLGGGIVDEDYMLFLHHLRDYFQSSNSTRNDDDDDDVDPHYKMFLEKLRLDGKSYVLKVALNNEVPLSLKYESEEDSSDDELVRPSIRKVSAVDTESLETVKDLQMKSQYNQTDIAREDMMYSAKSRTNCTESETMDSLVKD